MAAEAIGWQTTVPATTSALVGGPSVMSANAFGVA
jgi:hypothetical protein